MGGGDESRSSSMDKKSERHGVLVRRTDERGLHDGLECGALVQVQVQVQDM